MYDYSKLRGKIKEKGMTQEDLSKQLKISESTLSLKLNNQAIFGQDELDKLIEILNIPAREIKEYFFKEKV